jgi:hypothetical protein
VVARLLLSHSEVVAMDVLAFSIFFLYGFEVVDRLMLCGL